MSYDVAIIGAGSAGLFAALELASTKLRVVIIEGGLPPKARTSITTGVGGAGTFSDGKLNLSSKIGGNPDAIGCSSTELDALIEQVDTEFTRCGAPAQYSGENADALAQLKQSASQAGIEFIAARQRHLGTVTIREVIDTLYHDLLDKGIEFRLETKVESIATEDSGFRLDTSNGSVHARFVIAAPGRVGAYWLREQARALGVGPAFGPLDIGVRVEFPAELYESIERVMYD
ncbi:FAD-dependent oxidoreductase, partial [Candidatus Bipolaricaulota bacterium]|nr:FAD-dependent oxidoreductase [Candidatus Bipolaricaulota bacterium]